MAKNYLESLSVKVYPSALRGGTDSETQTTIYDPESRFGTESNLTKAINMLTVNGSFVVSDEIDGTGNLVFCLNGYYFKAKVSLGGNNVSALTALGEDKPDNIYAGIKLTSIASGSYNILSLTSFDNSSIILDNESIFKGLVFSDEPLTGDNTYSLCILKKSGNEYIVPATSFFRFDPKTIGIGNIPLSEILSQDKDNNNINLEVDNVTASNLKIDSIATINSLKSDSIALDKEENPSLGMKNGVAVKAQLIANADGSTPNIGTSSIPVYISSSGKPTSVDVIAVEHGGTGSNNLGDIKVGDSFHADTADALTTKNIGDANTAVYFNADGIATVGMKIYASTQAPSGGKPGDIWFRYN